MGQHDGKTEAPTPKRTRDARKKGQVAKSVDVSTWAQVLVAVTLMHLVVSRAHALLERTMVDVGQLVAAPDLNAALRLFGSASLQAFLTVLPLAGAMVAVSVVVTMAQTKGLVASAKLKPEFAMLNPAKGIKRLFSKLVLWEGVKTLVKLGLFSWASWRVARSTSMSLVGEPTTLMTAVGVIARATTRLVRDLALIGLVIAAADWVFQRRQMMKQLKMTKEEVKQESRESDGDPMMKSARRRRQMEMSRNRMMADVKTATAVIVNPTHYAVAIRYAPGSGAPTVVASGIDGIAARIKAEANRHRVPIVRDPPLARALHGACDVGDEIPLELYEAVARVLAFVMHLGRRAGWASVSGEHSMPGVSTLSTAQVGDPTADRERARARKAARRRGRRIGQEVRTTGGPQ